MGETAERPVWELMGRLFKAHPWHGVAIGPEAPATVTVYVEMVPTDTVKYEVDKVNGYLKVDRPQKYSSLVPSLYGFIPQTLCAERTGRHSAVRLRRNGIAGDGDPMDICVLTEKQITHGDILVEAAPIGGLRMLDGNQADDKIIAVMKGDLMYGGWRDIADCPDAVVERLKHYFLTYKDAPDTPVRKAEITHVYDRDEAHRVIRFSQADYGDHYPDLAALLSSALQR